MPRRTHSFSLPVHVLDELRRLAETRDESMSFLLREALRAYLREHVAETVLPAHDARRKQT